MRQLDKGAFSFIVFYLTHLRLLRQLQSPFGVSLSLAIFIQNCFNPRKWLYKWLANVGKEEAKSARRAIKAKRTFCLYCPSCAFCFPSTALPFTKINDARFAGLQNQSIITPFDEQFAGRGCHLDLSLRQFVDHRRQRGAACARA